MSEISEPVFEIFKDSKGEYRFRLKAPNGEIIAVGESYTTKANCRKGIESVKKNAQKAKIVEKGLKESEGSEEVKSVGQGGSVALLSMMIALVSLLMLLI